MIVGHVGIAFGARALDRRGEDACAPLLWLLAASIAPDVCDGVFALGQYCNPEGVFTHSLPAAAILATLFGVAAFLHTRSIVTALLVAALVMLHLPPDYLTGRKALWAGGPVVGLYIYRWGWLDFLAELPFVVGGWWMLRRARFPPRWVVSGLALASLLVVQGSFDVSTAVSGPRAPRVCTRWLVGRSVPGPYNVVLRLERHLRDRPHDDGATEVVPEQLLVRGRDFGGVRVRLDRVEFVDAEVHVERLTGSELHGLAVHDDVHDAIAALRRLAHDQGAAPGSAAAAVTSARLAALTMLHLDADDVLQER
jgi:hypothetical protein